MRRFDPGYVEMKRALGEGAVGAALMLHNLHRNVAAGAGFESWMAIVGSAPHEFDVGRFLLGTDYAAVSGVPAGRGGGGGAALHRAGDGGGAAGDGRGERQRGLWVRRARGVGRGDGDGGAEPGGGGAGERGAEGGGGVAEDWRPRFAEAYRRQDLAWVRAVESGVPAAGAASAWDGYWATLVAEAGVRALAEGRRVEVEAGEAPGLYRGVGRLTVGGGAARAVRDGMVRAGRCRVSVPPAGVFRPRYGGDG